MTDQENSPVVKAYRRQQALREKGDAIIHAFPPALRFKYEHKFLPEGATFESLMKKRDESAAEKEKLDKASNRLIILFFLLCGIDIVLMMTGATFFANSHDQAMRNVTMGAVGFTALFIVGFIVFQIWMKRNDKVNTAYEDTRKMYETHRNTFIDLIDPILDQYGTLQIHTEAQMRAHLKQLFSQELVAQEKLTDARYPADSLASMEAKLTAVKQANAKSSQLWKINETLGFGVTNKQGLYDSAKADVYR